MAMHVILGGGVLGISCAIIGLLINFTNVSCTILLYSYYSAIFIFLGHSAAI